MIRVPAYAMKFKVLPMQNTGVELQISYIRFRINRNFINPNSIRLIDG